MSVAFTVTNNQVTFNVSAIGPQGAQGTSGIPFTSIIPVTSSESLTAGQSGALFSNTTAVAEVDLSLPAAPSPIYPLSYTLFVGAAEVFSFIAPSGVTISNGSDSSSSGGSISSNTIGNLVTVTLLSATQWIVTSIVGVWELN